MTGVFVDEQIRTDIGERDVVLRVVRPLPHIDRRRRIQDELTGQERTDPPGDGLDVVHRRDHLRIAAHDHLAGESAAIISPVVRSQRENPATQLAVTQIGPNARPTRGFALGDLAGLR